MASLKEIKGRINSINGTLKITSAMKMVASAKLSKAQQAITGMLPYEQGLRHILTHLLGSGEGVVSPFIQEREVKKVAIVAFASNSSLCGGFNSNVIRQLNELIGKYSATIGRENLLVYPVGRKVADAVKKQGITPMGDFQQLSGKPAYQEASALAEDLMGKFLRDEVQRVELLYHHFKSTSTQVLTHATYLPIDLAAQAKEEGQDDKESISDYIIEPSIEAVITQLLPRTLRMRIYTVALDSSASEHAARTMAMQVATENAEDMLQELRLQYNKGRQQAITNELLDIVGGSMA